jgi:Glycosyl hydrolase family 9./N-terminal ig-like domain of cellulase.
MKANRANRRQPCCRSLLFFPALLLVLFTQLSGSASVVVPEGASLATPAVGSHRLNILTPALLELVRINSKQPNPAPVDGWDWVNGAAEFVPPDLSEIRVVVNGETNVPTGFGFKRRPIYAPLEGWDLRVANHLYVQLNSPVPDDALVQVIQSGSLWPTNMSFSATANPTRFNPAIHVNQEGYLPGFPKKAMVGYYAGNLGELSISNQAFSLVDARTGAIVFQGTLTQRNDVGFQIEPLPYQNVWEADFSSFNTPGQYRILIPGMGASFPFWIGEQTAMLFARTYALGMFHQRSGFDVAMPFTRFTHAADHLAPSIVPITDEGQNTFTWRTVSNYASVVNFDNPPQIAPLLTNPVAQLYPFVNAGPVDVSGGHFEAANYSKPTWNGASLVHVLMFAVDSLPGVAELDNLGIPESGDGISDALQEARWEADFLLKCQDADGGFYYMIHPVEREYEFDVLPEDGDPQIIWPKNTATTAACVAALLQCASSPRFQEAYPQAASNYMAKAMLGWQFLTNAIAQHGKAGAYQRIMHFDDAFTHDDDLAWAACELFLATGDEQFHTLLKTWCPDPDDPSTMRWGWWKMYASYGNMIRSYAGAVRSGRLEMDQIDTNYLARCLKAIEDGANDMLLWSQENAYGASYPEPSKRIAKAGWFYSTEQAFDLVVAQEFTPKPEYLEAIMANLNFESGCNPVNVSYLTGLGWKRQNIVVDQYSANDRRALPKMGVPIGNIQEGFVPTWLYGGELTDLTFPHDWEEIAPYALYDRWSDFWNVTTEASTANTVRSFAVALWLAGKTSLTNQAWQFTPATISAPQTPKPYGRPVTVSLEIADTNLIGARITWEAQGQQPSFGGTGFTFTPLPQEEPQWIEAEVQWPDGRRAFAVGTILVSSNAPPEISALASIAEGTFSFELSGTPNNVYVIQTSTNLTDWTSISTNQLSSEGVFEFVDASTGSSSLRFYRVKKAD